MNTFANRQLAIEKTLVIESLTSNLIKYMMGLDLNRSTKSLDNKSSSMTLRAKIDLLLDCGKVDKQTYSNLGHIMSIRNQFAHNIECNNFEDLPKYIDGIDKPLLKYCAAPGDSEKETLKSGFLGMWNQVMQLLTGEFAGINKEYQIISDQLRIHVTKYEEETLDNFGIVGKRNRAIFLNKMRELLKEDSEHKASEQLNMKMHQFLKENPSLRIE